MTKPRMTKEDKAFQAQMDLSTLQRAQQIQADKSRMAGAKAEAQKLIKTVAPIAQTQTKGKRGK